MLTEQEIRNAFIELVPNVEFYLIGSRSLPYIRNPHDYDYLVWCSSDEEVSKCVEWKRTHKHDFPRGIHWMIRYKQVITLFAYEEHFMNVDKFDLDIYDPMIMTKLLPDCQKVASYITDDPSKAKCYYHAYTLCCMWMNGNYELKDAEIGRINRFHDGEWTPSDFEALVDIWDQVSQEYSDLLSDPKNGE